MTSGHVVSVLYHEFTEAPTEVLAENSVGPARRGRLARVRAAVKNFPSIPNMSESGYTLSRAVRCYLADFVPMQIRARERPPNS